MGSGAWSGLGLEVPEKEDAGEGSCPDPPSPPPLFSPQAVAELASTPPCSFPVISASPLTSPAKPHSPNKAPGKDRTPHPMKFGSTAKAPAKCMLKYYKISECLTLALSGPLCPLNS